MTATNDTAANDAQKSGIEADPPCCAEHELQAQIEDYLLHQGPEPDVAAALWVAWQMLNRYPERNLLSIKRLAMYVGETAGEDAATRVGAQQ